jgi:hypothetical protein
LAVPLRYHAPMKATVMRFDEGERALLDKAARRLGVSAAAVLRMLVREYAPTLRCEARKGAAK